MQSLLLASVVLLLALLCTWAVVHFGRRAGEPEARLRRLARGFVLGGFAAAAFAFATDRAQRRVTLHEVVLETPAPGARHTVRFAVESPGVPHELLVVPSPAAMRSASGDCRLGVLWLDAEGRPLLEEACTLTRIRPRERMGVMRWIWDRARWDVVPPAGGVHSVELTFSAPDVGSVLVRVEDPTKTDGERAHGY